MSESIGITDEVVEKEFYRSTEKFHVIATWVGILLNLVWFIGDYFVLPGYWIPFLIFRACVSGLTVALLLTKKITGFSIYTVIFVLVLGISVQNAYMWSVMDLAHLQKHTFAYMALFIGVGMLVLWDIWYSIIVLVATVISNVIFFRIYSPLSPEEFLINGGLLILTVAVFCIFLIRTRYNLTRSEIRSRLELAQSKHIIEEERNVIKAKNREITDSINYARRIQLGILPTNEEMKNVLGDHFVLYQPKDIVSGDFYWCASTTTSDTKSKISVLAVSDCTGHGVPGAFMSMLGKTLLHQTLKNPDINSPADVLNFLNRELSKNLRSHESNFVIRDGMDIAFVAINFETRKIYYSGTNNPCWIVRGQEFIELKGDKHAISASGDTNSISFSNQSYDLLKGDCIYLFTDGYADQFGGPRTVSGGKKFKYKQMKSLVLEIHDLPMQKQKETFELTIKNWMGNLEQVDDILVIGIRMN